MKSRAIVVCSAAAVLVTLGCQGERAPAVTPIVTETPPKETAVEPVPAPVPVRHAGQFDQDVVRAVSAFKSWPKLTRTPRTAPAMCSFYPQYWTTSHISESGDEQTHGEKLYHLYAMDSKAYLGQTRMFGWEPGKGDPVPFEGIEQVLIKDAFLPVVVGNWPEEARRANDAALAKIKAERSGEAVPAVQEIPRVDWENSAYNGSDRLSEGDPMGQYLMIKYAADRPGTDQGWVYATVQPSGEIVQAGMIESCMGCHTKAPFGRMFGLGKDAP